MWSAAEDSEDTPERPRFGAGGLAWFRCWCENRKGVNGLTVELRAPVVDLLCERAHALVYWVSADDYRGADFSNGAWKVDGVAWAAAFDLCVAKASRALEDACDTKHCTSLDTWLAAEAAGALRSRGAIGGSAELTAELRTRLFIASMKRRNTWPVRCRGCGESFTPSRRKAVNCPTCRTEKTPKRRARKAAEQRERTPQALSLPIGNRLAELTAQVQGQLD